MILLEYFEFTWSRPPAHANHPIHVDGRISFETERSLHVVSLPLVEVSLSTGFASLGIEATFREKKRKNAKNFSTKALVVK